MRSRLPTLAPVGAGAVLVFTTVTAALPADPARPGKPGAVPERAAAILGTRCLSCHNPEKKAGGIDLSTRSAAAPVLGSTPAHSRLLRAVTTGKMPPAGKLPAGEMAALREWVRAGGVYPRQRLQAVNPADLPLWSLQPVRKPPVPKTPFDPLAKNPIDRFVFDRLAKRGLKPSPPASRLELLRRVTVDLTGLPPSAEEVSAFLADRSPDAYDRVVDRLLASPAYGERWGQHWLDVVRYGESNGYEQNHLRGNAWPYRDYVIRSFNDDKPFDRFLTEQLVGDVVGKGDPNVEVATGFLVAGVHDTVGNQTEEGRRQQRANDLDDIVSTVGEAFLGLTVGCAKCHDHKFDPVPQKDYYRLAAVFAGVRHGERPLAPRSLAADRQREVQAATQEERRLLGAVADLDSLAREKVLRAQGVSPVPRPAVNPRRNWDDFAPVSARFVRFVATSTSDGTEPCLDELEIWGPDGSRNLALASSGAKATASSLLPGHRIHQVAHLNDGRFGNDWSWISGARGSGWAQVELPAAVPVSRVVWSRDGGDPTRFTDRLPREYRIEVSEDGTSWRTVSTGADRAPAVEAIPAKALTDALTDEQRERRADLNAELAKVRARRASLAETKTAYVGQFATPDPIFVLKRGDVMQRAEEVSPGALSRMPSLGGELPAVEGTSGEPARRLALARWLTDRRNPLTPRVMVNRLWHHHFGRGLVATPSDFGRNGQPPSHPELLDWLASWFTESGTASEQYGSMGVREYGSRNLPKAQGLTVHPPDGGPNALSHPHTPTPPHAHTGSPNAHRPTPNAPQPWSLKRLHRLIVTSYTYRQASAADPKGMAADAGNQLLWRMPLRRMEAEAVRDAILFTTGKLDRSLGGPPYQLFKYRVVNVAIYEPREEFGPETWRRGVYRQAARAIRDDLLGTFDCPESSQRTPRRESTTTALQALSLLNGPFIQQQAGFLAERVEREAGQAPAGQVDRAFRLTFGRAPSTVERTAALRLVERYDLTTLCRGLLNANEFLYY